MTIGDDKNANKISIIQKHEGNKGVLLAQFYITLELKQFNKQVKEAREESTVDFVSKAVYDVTLYSTSREFVNLIQITILKLSNRRNLLNLKRKETMRR